MLNILVDKVVSSFVANFKSPPDVVVQAPGRVNLIGEHTDYIDGFVLPCAINFNTVIAAKRRQDNTVNVIALDYDNQQDSFDCSQSIQPSEHQWANYVRGVVQQLVFSEATIQGLDIVVTGNVPQGAGLSSSASFEVAIAKTFDALFNLNQSPQQLALLSQRAENEFVGCNCGIMDQLISAEGEDGHALLIDCRSLATEAVPLPQGYAVMIVNSNKQRGLVDSEYNMRREQCEQAAAFFGVPALRDVSLTQFSEQAHELSPVIRKRAQHVISENARTLAAMEAMRNNDMFALQQYMAESHASMRDDFEITVPEIDYLVSLIKNQVGTEGGVRMTGGGFGGCVVALVPEAMVGQVTQAIDEGYRQHTGLTADVFICSPEQGASVLVNV